LGIPIQFHQTRRLIPSGKAYRVTQLKDSIPSSSSYPRMSGRHCRSSTWPHLPSTSTVYSWLTGSPLDGLNKPFGSSSVQYYRQVFNSLSRKQCGNTIDWDRGYICQVARFDPSKGYHQLLEAYRQFREKLKESGEELGPQLILMGHGSVDDPDGAMIV
jgi:glycosyltransferase involved in cell wall biosynthesis